uniref:cDNA FLJ60826, weakly similar to Gamma-aminobutyric-acid receptor epsilon subunit n=1 Tax=Homo sapiens TaxID=9606 RepID=A8MT31_HUMAN|nr:unnamed protein product [Homo sapiens]
MRSPCPTRWSASTRMARCCTQLVSYPENEMIYKWENFKLEINEKNSWKLFQFDFTGVSNKTEIITTPVGDLNEEPRDLPRVAPRATLETLFTHPDQVQGSEGTALIVSRMWMEPVTQPAICRERHLVLLPFKIPRQEDF